jgi:PHD/YefM family antitoxin component YafN of YafNO toxin-antitoxin module
LKIDAVSAKVLSMETIAREQDETEYLLSSPANREHLEKSIREVEQGKVISFENLEQAIQRAEELAAIK